MMKLNVKKQEEGGGGEIESDRQTERKGEQA